MPRPRIVFLTPFECPDPDQGLGGILHTPVHVILDPPLVPGLSAGTQILNCRQTLPHLSAGSMMDMNNAGEWLSLIEVNVYLKDPSRTVGNFRV